ncbi:MAG: putative toxin-antitoxin system toxin component, PIN family [Candidatus Omnitrophica bacterium]|nr:putative toxin-antitoxin system toxin component, PIN family [Candidatus Omnitrophota bacterium]
MLKAVVDTNVFISGLLKSPSCRKIIDCLKKSKFILIISPQILDELIGVIARPKFHNVIVRKTAEKLIETIKTQASLVKPSQRVDVIKEDSADNRFLEAAIEAKADFIISGNKHLLLLKAFRNIPIVTPAKFLKMLKM